MNLPNLSYMTNVAQLRYVQLQCESTDFRNPDTEVGAFLTWRQRMECRLRGSFFLSRMKANPFYHYLLARTRYYDDVFLDAIGQSVHCIINIGCGSDSRAYRFAQQLKDRKVTVIECDQNEAIQVKQAIARQHWNTDHVSYRALDLNNASWDGLSELLEQKNSGPVLVMMEGVSPYIRTDTFEKFLALLAAKTVPGSLLAYDYKIAGPADDFGRSEKVRQPFRLGTDREEVGTFHERLGFTLQRMELSTELSSRLLPGIPSLFGEDCLLRLQRP